MSAGLTTEEARTTCGCTGGWNLRHSRMSPYPVRLHPCTSGCLLDRIEAFVRATYVPRHAGSLGRTITISEIAASVCPRALTKTERRRLVAEIRLAVFDDRLEEWRDSRGALVGVTPADWRTL